MKSADDASDVATKNVTGEIVDTHLGRITAERDCLETTSINDVTDWKGVERCVSVMDDVGL